MTPHLVRAQGAYKGLQMCAVITYTDTHTYMHPPTRTGLVEIDLHACTHTDTHTHAHADSHMYTHTQVVKSL